uniref:Orf c01013 protein n=1 Tax=Saccharolobus solfataricus TaxID=2287 RepID=P95911_SACSO|nr:orf c01013 [Saccharolobus solfataricus P2]
MQHYAFLTTSSISFIALMIRCLYSISLFLSTSLKNCANPSSSCTESSILLICLIGKNSLISSDPLAVILYLPSEVFSMTPSSSILLRSGYMEPGEGFQNPHVILLISSIISIPLLGDCHSNQSVINLNLPFCLAINSLILSVSIVINLNLPDYQFR